MKPSRNRQKEKGPAALKSSGGRQRIFVWIAMGCLALAVGYTSWGILRARTSAGLVQAQGAPQSISEPSDLEAIQSQPHVIYLRQEQAPYGQVSLVGLVPDAPICIRSSRRSPCLGNAFRF
jgi:hypothetical protein